MALHADDTQAPQVSYAGTSHSTVLLKMGGKEYIVDVAAQTIHESKPESSSSSAAPSGGAGLFREKCSSCHGPDGKGLRTTGTPDFTSPSIQSGLSDQQIVDTIRHGKPGKMPAWSGKLSEAQIQDLAAYVRSLSSSPPSSHPEAARSGVYQPGDDVLVSLPTGRPVDRHGLYFNFAHRFASEAAFTGSARAAELFGLDSVSISSFGFRYGVTDKLSVGAWRSPSFIGRPIQLMAAYNVLDENREAPLNMALRVSIQGQDNFKRSYTENVESIFSRTLTPRAQLYAVPTFSFNDRPLMAGGLQSARILDFPGVNAFSIGFGAAVDVRPTVALVAEVIPTLWNAADLGIHRPAYSFGIQKKVWRHAFTLALTNSPGTTDSQRAGTRATYLRKSNAGTPRGLFLGFDIMRQIH